MLTIAFPRLRILTAAMTLLVLLGCTATPSEPAPKLLTAEQAAARSVVPLTRAIALDKAGKVVDAMFDLPPPGPGTVPDLMLGLRVWGTDAKSALANEGRIKQRDVPAKIHLYALGEAQGTQVPLTYTRRDQRGEVAVGGDGIVPHTTSLSAASGALRTAGLVDGNLVYIERNFANWRPAHPGRYRLTVELAEARPELAGLHAEFVMGYALGSK